MLLEDDELALEQDGNGDLPIHLACKFNKEKAVKALCETLPDTVSAVNDDMNTPLHQACHSGNWKIIAYLVDKKGAYVEARNIFGETPFIIAALHGHKEVFGYLKAIRANFRAQDIEGESALHKAVYQHHLGIVEELLKLDLIYPTPPGEALVDLMDINRETALHELTKRKHNYKAQDDDPVHIMQTLLKNKAAVNNKNERGETFLHSVCLNASSELFDSYLNTLTPRQKRLYFGRGGTYHRLRDNDGNTILHKACEGNSLPIVLRLTHLRFPVNPWNNKGETALFVAVKKGNYDVARHLLTHRGRIKTSDTNGRNIIHAILDRKTLDEEDLKFLKEIVHAAPDLINSRDKEENSPLHVLAERGHQQALDFILQHLNGDADKNSRFIWKKNKGGQTAMDIANQKQFYELEKQIRGYSLDQLGARR